MSCFEHPNNPIILICTDKHECIRKLCANCVRKHGGVQDKLIPPQELLDELKKKFDEYQQNEQQYQKIKEDLKFMLGQMEKYIIQVKNDFEKLIEQFFQMVDKEEQYYFELLNSSQPIVEFSYTELNKLVDILENNTLEKQKAKKQKSYVYLKQKIILITQNLQSSLLNQKKNVEMIFNKMSKSQQILGVLKTINQVGFIWDYGQKPPQCIKTQYQVTFDQAQEVKYHKDGQIIRIDKSKVSFEQREVFANLEQVQNLHWIGDYGNNNQRIGQWIATWKGETLACVGGEYSDKGLKKGQWKEIIKNFWSKAQVYEIGEYKESLRKGKWKYIFNDQEFDGGEYNEQGQKTGRWIEVSESFWDYSQVTLEGVYKNGQKIGDWVILFRSYGSKQSQLIGGGSYTIKDDSSIKIGRWIELSDRFYESSQVTYNGEYINGQKFGRWDIYFNNDKQNSQIGGGLYDFKGDISVKIGRWIELSDGFCKNSQVTYCGEYQNGQKFGNWDIIHEKKKIGGGLYDQLKGDSVKVGRWIELNDGFQRDSQVTFQGEYTNGQKLGRWEILYKGIGKQNFEQIGGGMYQETIDGSKKFGNWIEVSDGFKDDSQITQIGDYKNDKKVGDWGILWRKLSTHPFEQIGGGKYDDQREQVSVKIGKWIELSDWFKDYSQLTYIGEYNEIGQKVGTWMEMYREYDKMDEGFKKIYEIRYDN